MRTDDGPVCEAAFEWNIGPSTKGYHQPAPQTRPCADADRPAHDSQQRAGAPAVFPEWRGRLAGSGIGSVSGPFVFSPYRNQVGSLSLFSVGRSRRAAKSGRQAAWNALNQTSAPSAPSEGESTPPAWAQSLRAEQSARHHQQVAVHALQQGDRGGASATPDIKERDE